MKKTSVIKTIFILTILAAAPVLAQFMGIVATGQARETKWGYVAGESYQMTWVVTDNYDLNSDFGGFSDTTNQWLNFIQGNTFFAAFYGDGITGTLNKSGVELSLLTDQVAEQGANGFFAVQVAGPSLGLMAGSVAIEDFYLAVQLTEATGTYPAAQGTLPATYIANHDPLQIATEGSYFNIGYQVDEFTFNSLAFDLTNVEFNANVVPEPATMALLGLGGILVRRRRKA